MSTMDRRFERRVVSRRAILVALGGSLLGGAAIVAGVEFARRGGDEPGVAEGPIARVGEAYLELVPEEASEEALTAKLPAIDADVAVEPQIAVLRSRIESDFATGDVLTVDGWLLSRTEARAAALVALDEQSS